LIGTMTLIPSLSAGTPQVNLTVDVNHVLRSDADHFVGVDLNYIRDLDANRPHARPLNEALNDLGVRWLRYPGGEKSDFYLWSQPPYEKPHPVSLGWYGTAPGERMDFNQFIACARAVHAEPYVVAGYDTLKRTGRTEEQWLENAVAWVRYANVVKKYGVKYWEIGNENWSNGTGTPEEMARIVTEFSRAMKAVDPIIQIGSSGNSNHWWSKFLPIAAPALDFISLSVYNCWDWKNYDYFVTHPAEDTIGDAETALNAIDLYAPEQDRKRLKVVVAEINSKDYSKDGWPGTNTLGHTLVTFDTLGRLMAHPHILTAMVWTTRWMNDAEAKNSQWYALGPHNEVLPTGRAIALWGQFVQKEMIAVDGPVGPVTAFASRSSDSRRMSIWVLNRSRDRVDNVHVTLSGSVHFHHALLHILSGTGPDDPSPRWELGGTTAVAENGLNLSCPGVSVTVLSLN
ncbi:MAG: hypothetical protein M3Y56_10705, partial [Armatimonadota bacterium]|nr:hypothetical protein [Armatimonadota bacterium]